MKHIAILTVALFSSFSAFCQTYLLDGDRCFDKGDYGCAITNYEQAIKIASGKDKQIAEIKLTRAKFCQDHIKIANQSFNKKEYSAAKTEYQNVLESNPKDSYVQSQLEKCKAALSPAATLSVSKENLSFSASGGTESIMVTTNKGLYSVNLLPSWCSIQKYSGYFVISCAANSSTNARNDFFMVVAGDKTVRINVSQSGKKEETKTETTLSATKSGLWFSSSGGRSEQIKIFSNAPYYSVSLVPSWLKVETHSGFIVVICTTNNSNVSRSGWFKVTAGEKELRITVNQEGVQYRNLNSPTSPSSNYSKTKTKKSFNSPKTKDTWGLTLGYVNYDFGEGPQFGLKVEPLFQYGFGLNTGINLEAYSVDAWSAFTEWKFQEYAVNIPLHLEYRLNFSKWFNIFIYGGAGFYAVTDANFSDYSLPSTFDYGGGFRVTHFQINVGRNLYLGDFKAFDLFGENIRPYQNYSVSMAFMF